MKKICILVQINCCLLKKTGGKSLKFRDVAVSYRTEFMSKDSYQNEMSRNKDENFYEHCITIVTRVFKEHE